MDCDTAGEPAAGLADVSQAPVPGHRSQRRSFDKRADRLQDAPRGACGKTHACHQRGESRVRAQIVPARVGLEERHAHVALLERLVSQGAPFPTGSSTIEQLDPATATHVPLISGLTTAIDMVPLPGAHRNGLLVLEHSSAGPFFNGPGTVLQFDSPAAMPTKVADCLKMPTSMPRDARTGVLYITEEGGNLVAMPYP